MIRLERIVRWPRLRRVDGWRPRIGEKCWFAQGGPHPLKTARVVFGAGEGKVRIAIVGSTGGAEMIDEVPEWRVWPQGDWREQQARFDVEGEVERNIKPSRPADNA